MKKLTLPTILLFSSSLVVAQAAEPAAANTAPKPAPVTQTAAVSPEDQKQLEAYGWIMGKQVVEGSMAQFGFSAAEKEFFLKGFMKGAQGMGTSPIVVKEDGDKLESFLEGKAAQQHKKMEAEVAEQAKKSKDSSKSFFEKLDKDTKVKKTASGLYYQVTKEGSKEMPKANSTVKIDYVGTLIDGTEFDSSKKRGQPATFSLEQVIPGFKEGLQLVGKGGSIRLYMPSELAYGDNPLPGIPAGSTLIFDVDMIDIPVAEKDAKATK